ncbi:MAG: conjugal transfer protein TraX, partial [Ruminococcus sp.]|nr:conjugal transfer protein TraX [Ruminococcus sp.]
MKHRLNANQIKLIAIIAMTIDHLTWALFPGLQTQWYVMALHIIGRLTAPIMWFFVAEGCHYTRNIKRYAGRLFLFAVVSHF